MLSKTQKERLRYIHSYGWLIEGNYNKTEESLQRVLKAVETIEELWYLSTIIQWSVEEGDLAYFYKHPLCDRGLAMTMYWCFSPNELYLSQQEGKLSSYEQPYLDLVKEIESLLTSDFYKRELIAFDLFNSSFKIKNKGLELIPDELKKPTEGSTFSLDTQFIFEDVDVDED